MAGGKGKGKGREAKNWGKTYQKSKMKEKQVECRYCRKLVAEQNYRRHLLQLHKEEYEKNPGDLRQYGEQSISLFAVRGAEGGETSGQKDRSRSPRKDGGDQGASGDESSR